MSVIFEEAAALWSEMSVDFFNYVDDAYNKALEATNGVLVNSLGRSKKIDGYILFRSTKAFAQKYASEELIEWWQAYPRLTMNEFERQWLSGRMEAQQQ